MYRLVAVAVIFQTFWFAEISANTCQIPENLTEVNWHTLASKTWYQSMTTNDSLYEGVTCKVLYHWDEVCPGTVSTEIIYYDKTYNPLHMSAISVRQRPGVYHIQPSNSADDFESTLKKSIYVADKETEADVDAIIAEEYFFITDSVNYVIFLFCGKGGNFNIWAFSPDMNPTPDHVMKTHVALRSHGIEGDIHFNNDCKKAMSHYCRICN